MPDRGRRYFDAIVHDGAGRHHLDPGPLVASGRVVRWRNAIVGANR